MKFGLRPLVLTCMLTWCALSVFSQTAAEPVPSTWLRNGKLAVEEFNFSIASPGPDSHWTYTQLPDVHGSKQTAFIVEALTDTKFMIIVWDRNGSMDSGSTKDFVDGMQKTMPKDWRVIDAKIEDSTFPLKGSSKITITMHLPNEVTLYVYGYLVGGARTYMFFDYSPETTEPPQFKQFVGSFAFLKPPNAGGNLVFYGMFSAGILLVWVIPIWISVKAKKLADKPFRWGTYVGIITGWLSVMFFIFAVRMSGASERIFATLVGLCAILCCIGLLRRRRFGVVFFIVSYLMLLITVPFLDALHNRPSSPQQQGQAFPTLVLLVATTIYFKKRWRLMGW